MKSLQNQYRSEYNYFCAMNSWAGKYSDYAMWRNRSNLSLMQSNEAS